MTKDLLKTESGGQVCLHRWDRSLLTGFSAAEMTVSAFRACPLEMDYCEVLISRFLNFLIRVNLP